MMHYICTIDKKTGVNLLSMQSIEYVPMDSPKFNANYTMQLINYEVFLEGVLRNLQKNTVYFVLDNSKELVSGKFYFVDGGSEDIGFSQNSWYTKLFSEFCAEKGIQIV